MQAYRYARLRVRGFDGLMTLYVAPTNGGVLTLACFARAADNQRFGAACERVARSVRLLAGRAYPVGPRREYQRALNTMLKQLDGARRRERAALRAASTRQAQANAALRLSDDFAVAHGATGRIVVLPHEETAHRRLLARIQSARIAYDRLARSARQGNASRYESAADAVTRAEGRVRAAIRALGVLGYRQRPYKT